MTNQKMFKYIFIIFLTCVLPSLSFAQARLLGRVTNSDGEPIVAAIVSLSGTGRTGAVLTNGQGFYTFLSLPVGKYSLRAVKSGSRSNTYDFYLADKSTTMMNLSLLSEAEIKKQAEAEALLAEASKVEKKRKPVRKIRRKRVRRPVKKKSPPEKSDETAEKTEVAAQETASADSLGQLALAENQPEVVEEIENKALQNALIRAEEEEKAYNAGFEKSLEIVGGVDEIYNYLEYPLSARNTPKPVMVIAKVFVNEHGRLKRVDILKKGPRVFNEEVYRVLTEEIKYNPAEMDSDPVPGSLTFVVNFSPKIKE